MSEFDAQRARDGANHYGGQELLEHLDQLVRMSRSKQASVAPEKRHNGPETRNAVRVLARGRTALLDELHRGRRELPQSG
jgi:hypothetical protein